MLYNDTITVFVQHGELWYPHVIKNTDVGITNSQNASTFGDKNLDTFEVLINCTKDKVITTTQGDVTYLPPKKFAALESPAGYITFDSDSTFIYADEYKDTVPLNTDDFDSGLYQHFKNIYDGVYKLHSAAFYSLIPHFELSGK